MGFLEAKRKVIEDLVNGNFGHEARADIDNKNLMVLNKITAAEVVEILKRCRGNEHVCSPHHQDPSTLVHVVVTGGFYIKFYFEPDTMFISVHPSEGQS